MAILEDVIRILRDRLFIVRSVPDGVMILLKRLQRIKVIIHPERINLTGHQHLVKVSMNSYAF